MRLISLFSILALINSASAQLDLCTGRYNYAFIEDSIVLIPLQGNYTVEYLARGQWWSYTDPRTPVNYPGKVLEMKSLINVNGSPIQVVEIGKDYTTTDNKLRVVRGADSMIVDLSSYGHLEERMQERTARVGVPPRPPVLVPFRKGWYDLQVLVEEPLTVELTDRFDNEWLKQSADIQALYDTARYEFSLYMDDSQLGPLEISIMRDPNYANHLVLFPASGEDMHFELYRQDSLGVADTIMSLRVDMPSDGAQGKWVDVTDLLSGKYTVYSKWKGQRSTMFYMVFGW